MLYLGLPNLVRMNDNIVIYNFTSFREGGEQLNLLPPISIDSMAYHYIDFDMFYYDYIFNNDDKFFEFYSKIINHLYIGTDVYLMVTDIEEYEPLHESLIKIIQSRYGYNPCLIFDESDYDMINNNLGFGSVNGLLGLNNLDFDKERFINLLYEFNPSLFKDESESI